MKSLNLGLGIVVASLALAAPVFAQRPESGGTTGGNAVDRSSGAGATSNAGSAVDRSGGGSVASGSSSAAVSSSSVDASSPSANAASSPSIGFGDRQRGVQRRRFVRRRIELVRLRHAIRIGRRRQPARHRQGAHRSSIRERRGLEQRERRAGSADVEPSARRSSRDRHGRGPHDPAARSQPWPLRLRRV